MCQVHPFPYYYSYRPGLGIPSESLPPMACVPWYRYQTNEAPSRVQSVINTPWDPSPSITCPDTGKNYQNTTFFGQKCPKRYTFSENKLILATFLSHMPLKKLKKSYHLKEYLPMLAHSHQSGTPGDFCNVMLNHQYLIFCQNVLNIPGRMQHNGPSQTGPGPGSHKSGVITRLSWSLQWLTQGMAAH